MLVKYPTGAFAANAHYWLGELYGLTGKNDQSATEFNTIIRDFLKSPKVADAQFQMGRIYVHNQMVEYQIRIQVISATPGTASARLASEQLREANQKAGH